LNFLPRHLKKLSRRNLLIFSGLAILHLIGVIFTLGIFNDVAIRDIGLLILAVGIFLEEARKIKNKNLKYKFWFKNYKKTML
jgi:hypothetical protein